jgi:DNA-binding transcriptional regulator WhiA
MSGQVLSFTLRAKEEIFAAKPLKGPRWLSFAYGLFLLGSQMDANTLTLTTEHKVVSLCYAEAFRILTGRRLDYKRSGKVGGRMRYHSSCSHPDSLTKLSRSLGFDANQPLSASHLSAEGAHRAFLSGAFMACASVTDPAKDYHLSFKPATEAAGDCLFELLCQMGYPPKTTLYRGEQLLYFKESEPIEDILTAVGAPICSLELMETKVFRDLRNKANRITNAETANIDKTVASAAAQIADIRYLTDKGQLQLLPPELQEIAALRLRHPEASLRELGELLDEPISRSGVNHRMRRLSDWADRLRRTEEKTEKET